MAQQNRTLTYLGVENGVDGGPFTEYVATAHGFTPAHDGPAPKYPVMTIESNGVLIRHSADMTRLIPTHRVIEVLTSTGEAE